MYLIHFFLGFRIKPKQEKLQYLTDINLEKLKGIKIKVINK